jgi:glycosyltransferase involved in cell wall biosynthesis
MSPREFADAIISVLWDELLRNALAATAVATARLEFDLRGMIEQYEEVNGELIECSKVKVPQGRYYEGARVA